MIKPEYLFRAKIFLAMASNAAAKTRDQAAADQQARIPELTGDSLALAKAREKEAELTELLEAQRSGASEGFNMLARSIENTEKQLATHHRAQKNLRDKLRDLRGTLEDERKQTACSQDLEAERKRTRDAHAEVEEIRGELEEARREIAGLKDSLVKLAKCRTGSLEKQ